MNEILDTLIQQLREIVSLRDARERVLQRNTIIAKAERALRETTNNAMPEHEQKRKIAEACRHAHTHYFNYVLLKFGNRATNDQLTWGVLAHTSYPYPELHLRFLEPAENLPLSVFRHFNPDAYRIITESLAHDVNQLNQQFLNGASVSLITFKDAHAVMRTLWSENGLSYFYSPIRHGTTGYMPYDADSIYEEIQQQHRTV